MKITSIVLFVALFGIVQARVGDHLQPEEELPAAPAVEANRELQLSLQGPDESIESVLASSLTVPGDDNPGIERDDGVKRVLIGVENKNYDKVAAKIVRKQLKALAKYEKALLKDKNDIAAEKSLKALKEDKVYKYKNFEVVSYLVPAEEVSETLATLNADVDVK
jgi:hypothetical protein